MESLSRGGKSRIFFIGLVLECAAIFCIAIASIFGQAGFALFYNAGYGLLVSIIVPLAISRKNEEPFSSFGIKPLQRQQYFVLAIFVLCSIGGQLVPLLINRTQIKFELLAICILPLMMTTFFEEFLFRGFLQTRMEKQCGWLVAILCSALLFSLYHLGYPGFRNLSDLILLFAVGLGFAVAFKLSGGNLFVVYFVNLPNAFLTYILKSSQFPVFTPQSSIFAAVTIILTVWVFWFYRRALALTPLKT